MADRERDEFVAKEHDGSNRLAKKSWSPYAVGAALGVLSTVAFATADHGLGITTAFEHTAALVHAPDVYAREHAPKVDWEWMLVVGVAIGAFLSSKLGRDRVHPTVPPLWARTFGPSRTLRFAAAAFGGFVMMLGARLARGCTSGHGITGALQLAVSSWLFIAIAFVMAIVVALVLFGRPRTVPGGE